MLRRRLRLSPDSAPDISSLPYLFLSYTPFKVTFQIHFQFWNQRLQRLHGYLTDNTRSQVLKLLSGSKVWLKQHCMCDNIQLLPCTFVRCMVLQQCVKQKFVLWLTSRWARSQTEVMFSTYPTKYGLRVRRSDGIWTAGTQVRLLDPVQTLLVTNAKRRH